jgi:hypothetical protein
MGGTGVLVGSGVPVGCDLFVGSGVLEGCGVFVGVGVVGASVPAQPTRRSETTKTAKILTEFFMIAVCPFLFSVILRTDILKSYRYIEGSLSCRIGAPKGLIFRKSTGTSHILVSPPCPLSGSDPVRATEVRHRRWGCTIPPSYYSGVRPVAHRPTGQYWIGRRPYLSPIVLSCNIRRWHCPCPG